MDIDEELKKQLDDDRIHKWWKKPRVAREFAGWLFLGGLILGVSVGIIFWDSTFDLYEKVQAEQPDYKQMILDYSDCHAIKLMLANEDLDYSFSQRLLSYWTVSCGA